MTASWFVPLILALMAYCAYYWTALTAGMIEDARYERTKRHLDWTKLHRRGLSKAGWRSWWPVSLR